MARHDYALAFRQQCILSYGIYLSHGPQGYVITCSQRFQGSHPDRHAAISPTATVVICFACTMSFRMTLKTAGRSTQTAACHPSDEAADVWLPLPRRLRNP
jgi:hypothetical protein